MKPSQIMIATTLCRLQSMKTKWTWS